MADLTLDFIFPGHAIGTVQFDGQKFRIEIVPRNGGGPPYELHVEGKFNVTHGKVRIGEQSLATLEVLEGQPAVGVHVDEDGTATVACASDLKLIVEPDSRYESWQLYGPSGFLWVCGPGGRMTTWRPH